MAISLFMFFGFKKCWNFEIKKVLKNPESYWRNRGAGMMPYQHKMMLKGPKIKTHYISILVKRRLFFCRIINPDRVGVTKFYALLWFKFIVFPRFSLLSCRTLFSRPKTLKIFWHSLKCNLWSNADCGSKSCWLGGRRLY